MRNRVVVIILLCLNLSLCAQNPPLSQPQVFNPSKSQKGVRISTDVFALLLPAAGLTLTLCEKDWKGLLQGFETAAATASLTLLLKYTVKEQRPDFSNNHSFPSGHAAVTFASAAYLQRRYGWSWGAPAYVIATYVGWGRCFAKKHYWYDVLAGAAIGAGSAYIFTRPFVKKHDVKISPVTDGENIGIYASFSF
ncbi:MAG: phosphatase PAP2 family protein [Muribaculaceae bacterium]|nr:phosphatase PAP2 family protein [Muribaculaceae bacterium]